MKLKVRNFNYGMEFYVRHSSGKKHSQSFNFLHSACNRSRAARANGAILNRQFCLFVSLPKKKQKFDCTYGGETMAGKTRQLHLLEWEFVPGSNGHISCSNQNENAGMLFFFLYLLFIDAISNNENDIKHVLSLTIVKCYAHSIAYTLQPTDLMKWSDNSQLCIGYIDTYLESFYVLGV